MASPWHKYDGINTMEQKGAKARNDTAHPGFSNVASKIASRQGVSKAEASAELAASTRRASPAAHKANPRLNRVKGK